MVFRLRLIILIMALIAITSGAYAQVLGDGDPALTEKTLIPDAQKGDIEAQFRLGQIYSYGDKGAKIDHATSFFWFSICEYSTSDVSHISREEMQKILETRTIGEKAIADDQLAAMYIKHNYRRVCEQELKGLSFKVTPEEISSTDPLIQKWKKAHPLPVLARVRLLGDDDPALSDQTLIPRARQGDTNAQAALVEIYFNGTQGAKTNANEGYFWYSVWEYATSNIPDVSAEEMKKILAGPIAESSLRPKGLTLTGNSAEIYQKYQIRKIYGERIKKVRDDYPTIAAHIEAAIQKWKENHPQADR